MKKKFLILLIAIILMPIKVFASGGFNVSTSSISMYPGESRTVTISSYNSVGKLNISSSNSGVASVNMGSAFIQTPGASQSFTISSNSVGTSIISVVASSNFATMDEEILAGQTRTITVSVINRPTQNNNSNNNANSNNANSNNNKNTNTTTKVTESSKSTNNNVKEITVEGYELVKVDNNNYKLSVSNNVTSITLKATAEDSKSTITGTGSHELKIGDNNIEIIVTSESGGQNKINVIINRKDSFYLEDLTNILKDKKINDINIKISNDSKLSKEQLKLIKKSGKVVNFNYYDENKVLKYSWTINGNKIKDLNELQFNIKNSSDNSKKILKLSNYALGLYLSFQNKGNLPKETKIKYFVGDLYSDNDKVNLYYYNKNKLEKLQTNLLVKDGYIEFEAKYCSDYFISMTELSNNSTKKSFNWFLAISIIEFVLLILSILYHIIKTKKKNNKDNVIIKTDNNDNIVNKNYENNGRLINNTYFYNKPDTTKKD